MKNVLCVRTIKITKFKNIHEYFQKTMVWSLRRDFFWRNLYAT